MQGRLSPRPPDRLQVFPGEAWPQELDRAARLGFEFVEWLLLPRAEGENPLDTAAGRAEIRRQATAARVPVVSVCAVRLMTEPLGQLPEVLRAAAEVGASRVLVPLLERAHVRTPEREDAALAVLEACLPEAARLGLSLVLELDLSGEDSARLLRRLGSPRARVCYDTGNATALGLPIATDVRPLLPWLGEVHAKDRLVGGPSVRLGDGHADFPGFFATLSAGSWSGDVVLEHFFATDPEGDGRQALRFVREALRAAGL